MTTIAQKIACLALLAVFAMPLAACNTVEGLGKDTQAAGDALTGAARETKAY